MATDLGRLIGSWAFEATHPERPGLIVSGTVHTDWLSGERFLEQRGVYHHRDFPDWTAIIGIMDQDRADHDIGTDATPIAAEPLRMHYFDARGIHRNFETAIDETSWRYERISPGFSQRFTGTFRDDGDTIDGLCQLHRDERGWQDDLRITHRRV